VILDDEEDGPQAAGTSIEAQQLVAKAFGRRTLDPSQLMATDVGNNTFDDDESEGEDDDDDEDEEEEDEDEEDGSELSRRVATSKRASGLAQVLLTSPLKSVVAVDDNSNSATAGSGGGGGGIGAVGEAVAATATVSPLLDGFASDEGSGLKKDNSKLDRQVTVGRNAGNDRGGDGDSSDGFEMVDVEESGGGGGGGGDEGSRRQRRRRKELVDSIRAASYEYRPDERPLRFLDVTVVRPEAVTTGRLVLTTLSLYFHPATQQPEKSKREAEMSERLKLGSGGHQRDQRWNLETLKAVYGRRYLLRPDCALEFYFCNNGDSGGSGGSGGCSSGGGEEESVSSGSSSIRSRGSSSAGSDTDTDSSSSSSVFVVCKDASKRQRLWQDLRALVRGKTVATATNSGRGCGGSGKSGGGAVSKLGVSSRLMGSSSSLSVPPSRH
jgi:hypothetical protein